jgi:hypothetical protein
MLHSCDESLGSEIENCRGQNLRFKDLVGNWNLVFMSSLIVGFLWEGPADPGALNINYPICRSN